MFPIIDYIFQELIDLLKDAKEISQQNNTSANSQLYIFENGLVFKLYIPKSDYLRNVKNLLLLKEYHELKKVKEVVLLMELIWMQDNIVGYFMTCVKGRTMASFLHDPAIVQKAYSCYNTLAEMGWVYLECNVMCIMLHNSF